MYIDLLVMYNSILLFMNIGGPEMILIFLVVLLLFGGKKLPELARGLGKGLREFKDASDGIKREIHNNINTVNEAADLEKSTAKTAAAYPASETTYPDTESPYSETAYSETDSVLDTNTSSNASTETGNPDEAGFEHTKIAH